MQNIDFSSWIELEQLQKNIQYEPSSSKSWNTEKIRFFQGVWDLKIEENSSIFKKISVRERPNFTKRTSDKAFPIVNNQWIDNQRWKQNEERYL